MKPALRAQDRLVISGAFACMLHALAIFGVSFDFNLEPNNLIPSLDVILVQTRSDARPEQADYLAQANQDGGGESENRDRPREMFSSALPRPEPGVAPRELNPGAPKAQRGEVQPVDALTVRNAPSAVFSQPSSETIQPLPLPEDTQLLAQRIREARLAAEVSASSQAYAKRPKRKFITAKTREYEFATYMAGWAAKVERMGNLNYPPEARRRGLYGELVLTVAIRRDGTIEGIEVIRASGHNVLDDAAQQIVRMSAPFAMLPQTREEVDILHITRTWRFLPGNVLRSQ